MRVSVFIATAWDLDFTLNGTVAESTRDVWSHITSHKHVTTTVEKKTNKIRHAYVSAMKNFCKVP